MASKTATFLAFRSVVKRSLTTSTPTRVFPRPRQVEIHPPYQTSSIASKATKGRKLPRNHFTSNSQPLQDTSKDSLPAKDVQKEQRQPRPKRKAAQRQNKDTSLRRVAVQAQQSQHTPVKGRGKKRYVDRNAETKDITAYSAAEKYDLYIARDLLEKEGYQADPFNTELFPQVLHVQTPPSWFRGEADAQAASGMLDEQKGDIFIFPSGTVVVWNVSERLGLHLITKVLKLAAENSHPEEIEDLDYIEDPTREQSRIFGDTIVLGTKPSQYAQNESEPASSPDADDRTSPDLDTTLAKIAFSSALARSTKLAVLENTLSNYMSATKHIPATLAAGGKPSVTRKLVLRRTGELLKMRAELNLYSELTDSLPDIFWDSPHSLGLESHYDATSSALDVEIRIRSLNEKMDYAQEITAVLREQLGEKHGHDLEWIIIWLIVVEVLFGCYHIAVEWGEWLDPESETSLAKEWYRRELGRIDGLKGETAREG